MFMPYHSSCHIHACRCAPTCGLSKKERRFIQLLDRLFVRLFLCLFVYSFSFRIFRIPKLMREWDKATKIQIIKLNCMPSIYHCFPQRCVMYKFFQFRLHAPVAEFNAAQFICTHQWHISRCWLRFPFDLIECYSSTQNAWIINMKAKEKEKKCDSIKFELENTLAACISDMKSEYGWRQSEHNECLTVNTLHTQTIRFG